MMSVRNINQAIKLCLNREEDAENFHRKSKLTFRLPLSLLGKLLTERTWICAIPQICFPCFLLIHHPNHKTVQQQTNISDSNNPHHKNHAFVLIPDYIKISPMLSYCTLRETHTQIMMRLPL